MADIKEVYTCHCGCGYVAYRVEDDWFTCPPHSEDTYQGGPLPEVLKRMGERGAE